MVFKCNRIHVSGLNTKLTSFHGRPPPTAPLPSTLLETVRHNEHVNTIIRKMKRMVLRVGMVAGLVFRIRR